MLRLNSEEAQLNDVDVLFCYGSTWPAFGKDIYAAGLVTAALHNYEWVGGSVGGRKEGRKEGRKRKGGWMYR